MPACFCAPTAAPTSVPIIVIGEDNLSQTIENIEPSAALWVKANGFSGQAGTMLLLPDSDGGLGHVLFGVGAGEPPPMIYGKLANQLPAGDYHFATEFAGLDAAVLAFGLGAYRFERFIKPREKLIRLVIDLDRFAEVRRIVRTVHFVRDLVNTPANELGTEELAAIARELAASHGAEVTEFVGKDLVDNNFPLVHAVGSGSPRAPRLLTFVWDGSGAAEPVKITLVGKGVVFDTGGLNIKTGNYMALMKKDMGGAANVLGLARLIMEKGLPVRLRVVLPIVENAVSGTSYRPGDVFRSRKGLTVEIGDTDAEGRLILADALCFADEEAPDLLIDLATLTGAARVALGPDLPPIYTRDDKFADELALSSVKVADPLWRMPLWTPYDDWLKSKIADINNITSGGHAGSMTAALFLGRFVDRAKTWMHGDIFAWVPTAKPGQPEGGEAQVIRALYDYLQRRIGDA